MYKVLLVDDEYYIRQRLRTCIDWEQEGFSIGGLAPNATEAFNLLSDGSFSLAVVDISMPQKDGLTLIGELYDNQIDTKIIILSGYGTFEYAQKAIKFGVTEYLLKPLDEEELIKSIRKIKHHLDAEQKSHLINQERCHSNYLLNLIQKNNYFKTIFANQPLPISDMDSLECKLANYDLKKGSTCHIVVFDLECTCMQNLSLEDLRLYQSIISNVISEIAQDFFHVTTTQDIYSHGVLIIQHECYDDLKFLANLDNLVMQAKNELNLSICLGCSDVFSLSLKNLNVQYHYALRAYVQSNLKKKPYVLFDSHQKCIPISLSVNRILEKIKVFISSKDKSNLCSAMDELFDLFENDSFSFFDLDQTLFKLITDCSRGVDDIDAELPNDFSYLLGYKDLLFTGYDLNSIKQIILQRFLSLLATQHSPIGAKDILIEEAIRFINEHYTRYDLNLGLISKNLLISPSYLSTVFKKNTGLSINQYITKLRMEKSKEYLKNNQLTLTDIAQKIGYNDSFYFSKVFKRYFGVSPSVYRN